MGEVPQGCGNVVEAVDGVDDLEVLVLGRQAPGDAALPSVDQGERERPCHGGAPGSAQQRAPGQPGGEERPVHDHGEGHHDRGGGTGADVRLPMAVQRRPADMKVPVTVFQDCADHSRRRDEQRCGKSRGQVAEKIAVHTGTLGRGQPDETPVILDVSISSWVAGPVRGRSRPTDETCATIDSPPPPVSGAALCAAPGSPPWSATSDPSETRISRKERSTEVPPAGVRLCA